MVHKHSYQNSQYFTLANYCYFAIVVILYLQKIYSKQGSNISDVPNLYFIFWIKNQLGA